MKYIIILLVITLLPSYTYSNGVLNVSGNQVDAMLQNPKVVQKHIKCLQCIGPCDRIGQELKRVLPYIASTKCKDCTPTERINTGKIINHVQTYYPKEWADLNGSIRSGRRC